MCVVFHNDAYLSRNKRECNFPDNDVMLIVGIHKKSSRVSPPPRVCVLKLCSDVGGWVEEDDDKVA